MLQIDNTLVSLDLFDVKFVCDLQKCKGACCVEGDSGAPLSEFECEKIAEIYPIIKPYLSRQSQDSIAAQGFSVVDSDGDTVTPLVSDKQECVYGIWDGDIIHCAIERAYFEGKVNFRKPISCHLFPVRITEYRNFVGVNYCKISLCNDALTCGKQAQIPIYQFCKDSLIRQFGEKWYEQLVYAYQNMEKEGS